MPIMAAIAGSASLMAKVGAGAMGKTVGSSSAFAKLTTGQQLAVGAGVEGGRRAVQDAHRKRNREL